MIIHQIEGFDELKDEAFLYEKIKKAAPKASCNIRKQKSRDEFNKKVVKDEIFGKNALVAKADKKQFVFYARYVLKSYNEDFIKERILERYNTETKVKILKGPENRKTRTVRITATKIYHLREVLEKEMIEIAFTKHRVTLPTSNSTQICFACGQNGHRRKHWIFDKCDKSTFITELTSKIGEYNIMTKNLINIDNINKYITKYF